MRALLLRGGNESKKSSQERTIENLEAHIKRFEQDADSALVHQVLILFSFSEKYFLHF